MNLHRHRFSFFTRPALSVVALVILLFMHTKAQAQIRLPIDDQSAVIFAYHHIGDDLSPSANLDREQFEDHINELKSGNYYVLPIPEIVEALKIGKRLPDPAIGITFEGAYWNTLSYAAPLLLKAKLPFTIFISTDAIDSKTNDSPTWDELRRLAKSNLVTIGLNPANYQKLHDKAPAEIARQINKAIVRYREELGKEATLFSYPFGEYSLAYKEIVERQGFKAAFGQQSGVAYAGADMFALPRFSMTEQYGDIERFRLTARTLPLPVKDISPRASYIANNKPEIGFTIDPALKDYIQSLSCFSSAAQKIQPQMLGNNRIEIRMEKPLEDERIRINCTMPGPPDETGDQPRWRWLGMMAVTPTLYNKMEGSSTNSASNLTDEMESRIE